MADLRKSIGILPLVALGAAGVIGSSWIYTNSDFFASYGAGGEIFGLLIAAVFACGVAISYGELASAVPRAGGEVVYAYTAFNRPTAFAAGWLLVGAYVSSLAFYVTAFGTLLTDLFPGLETVPLFTLAGETVYLPVLAVGVALTLAVFALNWCGVDIGASIQLIFFTTMVVLGLALVVVGFTQGSPDNFWPAYTDAQDPIASTARFILPGLTFLTGFGLVAIMAEDADLDPRKIGRTVATSVLVAVSFYVLVLLASAWIIPWETTATLEQGTISAFKRAGYDWLGWGAYAISVLGLLTSFVALFLATSRILLAMGRAQLLPSVLGRVHGPRKTPGPALIFTLLATLGIGWLGPGAITWFLDSGGVHIGLAWTLGVACLYQMRRRFPDLDRPYRVRQMWMPGAGAVMALGVIGFALYPGTDLSLVWPEEYVMLVGWFALGLVMYALAGRGDTDAARRDLLGPYYDDTFGRRRGPSPDGRGAAQDV